MYTHILYEPNTVRGEVLCDGRIEAGGTAFICVKRVFIIVCAIFSHFIYDHQFPPVFSLEPRLRNQWMVVGFVRVRWCCCYFNRNRVDGTSPRTINIFAINFLILSVWSANSVFYDILRLSIPRDIIAHSYPIALCVYAFKWTGMSCCCTNFGSVLTLFICIFSFRLVFLCVFLHISLNLFGCVCAWNFRIFWGDIWVQWNQTT